MHVRMRLLNTTTLELKFFAADRPRYAILSHRWEDEEVTFGDLLPGGNALELKGYAKLENSARVAREGGYDYIWIDTCCIDKSSSAELSEAINSMFRWYGESDNCIVYLSDISDTRIFHSRWFTRGWTLQELIAPRDVHFYDMFWEPRGTKDSLRDQIYLATGITTDVLLGADLGTIPACCKMSWAAGRTTTRAEDLAYCLLGLFDVNMPLLYGEGSEKAFRRLQETFVRQSDDESIFAWRATAEEVAQKPYWGLLAPSPDYFKDSGHYSIPQFKVWRHGGATEVTNKGLRVPLDLEPKASDPSGTLFLAPLNCSYLEKSENDITSAFTILLQRVSEFEDQYTRIRPDKVVPMSDDPQGEQDETSSTEIISRQLFIRSIPTKSDPVSGFSVEKKQMVKFNFPTNSSKGPVVYEGFAYMRFTGTEMWKLSKTDPPRLSVDLNKLTSGLDPVALDVQKLQQRRVVAKLEVDFMSVVKDTGPVPVQYPMAAKKAHLLVGFEPLPPNGMETPPGYVRPWYSFATDDQGDLEDMIGSEDKLQLTYNAPGGCHVKVRFNAATHRFRTFYQISIVHAKDG